MKKANIEKFINICKMSQIELKSYLINELAKTYTSITSADGFIYAQGNFPVLLVAHMDTVHQSLPSEILYDKPNGIISSPQGIGGDDRCGIYMILEVIKKFNCSVLFTEDEEIGCVGAEKFIKAQGIYALKFNYIIEFDRKGSNDAVFYECENYDFEDFVTEEFYKTNYGSFSDISVIAPILGCAAVNLSCGYYNAHTTKEYVVLKEMQDSINAACKMLERTTETDVFEYVEDQFNGSYYYGSMFGRGGNGKEENYCIWYETINGTENCVFVTATSMEEAIGIFLMEHPNYCYGQVLDCYPETYSK